jgi:RNA polymerase sigma factor (sigma-70 family)
LPSLDTFRRPNTVVKSKAANWHRGFAAVTHSCNEPSAGGNKQAMGNTKTVAGAREDIERFEGIFRRHHKAVVAYVRRRAPTSVVDDITDETFLVAWRRLDDVPAEELPWLMAVASNVLATERRGAGRRFALNLRLHSQTRPSDLAWDPTVAVEATDVRLAAALGQLRPKELEALLLVAWEELEPQEAAIVLGESPGAFRTRLHRARARLQELLEPHSPTSAAIAVQPPNAATKGAI